MLLIFVRFFVKERAFYLTCAHVTGRPNFVMFGIALMFNMFGDEGVRVASMLTPVTVLPINFIGMILISLALADPNLSMPKLIKDTAYTCFTNPIIVAALSGLVLSLINIRLPVFVESFLTPMSRVGNPVALLLLGSQIDLKGFKESMAGVAAICVAKLVLIPLVMVTGAALLGFRDVQLAAILIYFGSPIGAACAVLHAHYNLYPKFVAQVVTVTSVLSGLTIFFWISAMRWLQLF